MLANVSLRNVVMWIETALAGSLPPSVQRVMHIELSMSLAHGVFYASIIPFTQVVLRRQGASVDMLALYTSLLFVGSIFTSFSIVLMRRRRTIKLIVFCWMLGRSLFLLTALVSGPVPLMVISSLFWLLEAFVIPAYTRVIQKIYPESGRGKVMSTVRMGRVSVILLITPLAGWPWTTWATRCYFRSARSLASSPRLSSPALTSTRGYCRRARPKHSRICGRSCAPIETSPSICSVTRFSGWAV